MLLIAAGRSLPRGERPTPTTRDRRVDGLQRVVAGGEERAARRGRGVEPGRVELWPPGTPAGSARCRRRTAFTVGKRGRDARRARRRTPPACRAPPRARAAGTGRSRSTTSRPCRLGRRDASVERLAPGDRRAVARLQRDREHGLPQPQRSPSRRRTPRRRRRRTSPCRRSRRRPRPDAAAAPARATTAAASGEHVAFRSASSSRVRRPPRRGRSRARPVVRERLGGSLSAAIASSTASRSPGAVSHRVVGGQAGLGRGARRSPGGCRVVEPAPC